MGQGWLPLLLGSWVSIMGAAEAPREVLEATTTPQADERGSFSESPVGASPSATEAWG